MSRWQGFYPPATREPHSLSVSVSAPFVVSLDPYGCSLVRSAFTPRRLTDETTGLRVVENPSPGSYDCVDSGPKMDVGLKGHTRLSPARTRPFVSL